MALSAGMRQAIGIARNMRKERFGHDAAMQEQREATTMRGQDLDMRGQDLEQARHGDTHALARERLGHDVQSHGDMMGYRQQYLGQADRHFTEGQAFNEKWNRAEMGHTQREAGLNRAHDVNVHDLNLMEAGQPTYIQGVDEDGNKTFFPVPGYGPYGQQVDSVDRHIPTNTDNPPTNQNPEATDARKDLNAPPEKQQGGPTRLEEALKDSSHPWWSTPGAVQLAANLSGQARAQLEEAIREGDSHRVAKLLGFHKK